MAEAAGRSDSWGTPGNKMSPRRRGTRQTPTTVNDGLGGGSSLSRALPGFPEFPAPPAAGGGRTPTLRRASLAVGATGKAGCSCSTERRLTVAGGGPRQWAREVVSWGVVGGGRRPGGRNPRSGPPRTQTQVFRHSCSPRSAHTPRTHLALSPRPAVPVVRVWPSARPALRAQCVGCSRP